MFITDDAFWIMAVARLRLTLVLGAEDLKSGAHFSVTLILSFFSFVDLFILLFFSSL